MSSADEFRESVEAFLRETKTKPTTFGKLVLGDPGFVFGLRAGRVPSLSTAEKVKGFMEREQERLAS